MDLVECSWCSLHFGLNGKPVAKDTQLAPLAWPIPTVTS